MRSRSSYLMASFLCLLTVASPIFPRRRSKKKPAAQQEEITQEPTQEPIQQVPVHNEEAEDAKVTMPLKKKLCIVRVLLDESATLKKWLVSSKDGFILWDPDRPEKKIKSYATDIVISTKNGKLYLDKKPFEHKRIYLKPLSDTSTLNGHCYHGAFLVEQNATRTLLINCIDLEDYVCSVLRTESWPGWPLEVNKAFAIVSRSYAIFMVKHAIKNKQPYHVKNTNEHQTYSGAHTNEMITKAVRDTNGVFIAYKNEPILAMFDSCCGGIIPANIANFDFNKVPYLARTYPCTYCKHCKIYSWQAVVDLKELEHKLNQKLVNITKLTDVKVSKKDKAGLVQEVVFKNKKKSEKVSGKQVYSLLGPVKSFCFDVYKKAEKVVFKGRGFGHHIGLCQWGAREMVRDGWDYRRILQFYYPGTNLKRLV